MQDKKNSILKPPNGFSLIEIMVAMGLMVFVGLGLSSLITGMNREQKKIEEKMSLIETKNLLTSMLMDSSSCVSQLNPGSIMADISDATTTTPSVNNFNYSVFRVSSDPTAPILAQVGAVLPGTAIKVKSIKLKQVFATGAAGSYKGTVEIEPDSDTTLGVRRSVLIPILFSANLPTTSATVASCSAVSSGFLGKPTSLGVFTTTYLGTNLKPYAIMIAANGGKWNGGGSSSNPCNLQGTSDGVLVATQIDNNDLYAKYCHITFWVPANKTFKVDSDPYPMHNGQFELIEFK